MRFHYGKASCKEALGEDVSTDGLCAPIGTSSTLLHIAMALLHRPLLHRPLLHIATELLHMALCPCGSLPLGDRLKSLAIQRKISGNVMIANASRVQKNAFDFAVRRPQFNGKRLASRPSKLILVVSII